MNDILYNSKKERKSLRLKSLMMLKKNNSIKLERKSRSDSII